MKNAIASLRKLFQRKNQPLDAVELLVQSSQNDASLILIFGIGGSGKTSFVKAYSGQLSGCVICISLDWHWEAAWDNRPCPETSVLAAVGSWRNHGETVSQPRELAAVLDNRNDGVFTVDVAVPMRPGKGDLLCSRLDELTGAIEARCRNIDAANQRRLTVVVDGFPTCNGPDVGLSSLAQRLLILNAGQSNHVQTRLVAVTSNPTVVAHILPHVGHMVALTSEPNEVLLEWLSSGMPDAQQRHEALRFALLSARCGDAVYRAEAWRAAGRAAVSCRVPWVN